MFLVISFIVLNPCVNAGFVVVDFVIVETLDTADCYI